MGLESGYAVCSARLSPNLTEANGVCSVRSVLERNLSQGWTWLKSEALRCIRKPEDAAVIFED